MKKGMTIQEHTRHSREQDAQGRRRLIRAMTHMAAAQKFLRRVEAGKSTPTNPQRACGAKEDI